MVPGGVSPGGRLPNIGLLYGAVGTLPRERPGPARLSAYAALRHAWMRRYPRRDHPIRREGGTREARLPHRLLVLRPARGHHRRDRALRIARLRLDMDSRGVWLRLPDAARVVGRV